MDIKALPVIGPLVEKFTNATRKPPADDAYYGIDFLGDCGCIGTEVPPKAKPKSVPVHPDKLRPFM